MFATAIIGRTVGVKYAIRIKVRPTMRSLTHTAIRSARAIERNRAEREPQIVAQGLPEDRVVQHQPVILEAHETRGRLGRAVE